MTTRFDHFDTGALQRIAGDLPIGGNWSGAGDADDFTVPIIDRRWPLEPVKVGDAVVFTDEQGVRFEGTVAPGVVGLLDGGYSFNVNPQRKRKSMTKIRISAGEQPLGGGMFQPPRSGPVVEVEIKSDAEPDALRDLLVAGQVAATGLAVAAGIMPYEPPVVTDIAVVDPPPAPAAEDAVVDDDSTEALAVSNRRMYGAIGSAAENIRDVAKELSDEEGAAPTEERARVLGATLDAAAETLEASRRTP